MTQAEIDELDRQVRSEEISDEEYYGTLRDEVSRLHPGMDFCEVENMVGVQLKSLALGGDDPITSGKYAQISFSPDTTSGEMIGRSDVNGNFHESEIVRVFRDGGVILFDEIIDEICTTDFSEMKWKFMQQLEEGDSVDVERWHAGQERCWTGVRRMPKPRRTVRVYVNFGGNCDRSKEELAIAGAVGVTFAEIMESMGVAAEIWGTHFTHGLDANGNDYVDMVRLKAQNEYSDLGLINFMLGDDGVFRNVLFRTWLAKAAQNGLDTAWGLGQSRLCTLETLGLTPAERRSAVMVPQLFTTDAAKDWLAKTLNNPATLQPEAAETV